MFPESRCESKQPVGSRREAAASRRVDEPPRDAGRSRGLTLIELLVVVTVLLTLLGVAVPLMKPALKRGRLRESARQVNAYFTMAKARAVQLGRPAGVWLQRNGPGSNACLDLFFAEMPPPYSGDLQGALVLFHNAAPPDAPAEVWVADQRSTFASGFLAAETMHGMLNPDGGNVSSGALIKPGETFFIRFNFKGPLYRITRGHPANPVLNNPAQFALDIGIRPPQGAMFFPNESPPQPGLPFQVFRAPARTSGRTLQLSGGATIDLENSGIGVDGRQFATLDPNDSLPVIVMFFPGGGVERVVGGEWDPVLKTTLPRTVSPTSTIHFLVGRTEGLEAADDTPEAPNRLPYSAADNTETLAYNKNLADTETFWISIGHRTGVITSSENGWQLSPPPPWPDGKPYLLNSLRAAREFAQTAQNLGGV